MVALTKAKEKFEENANPANADEMPQSITPFRPAVASCCGIAKKVRTNCHIRNAIAKL